MKKLVVLLSVVTIIMGLVFTVPAIAGKPGGDPPAPNHEIIVSKDGNGDFTTITDALASITDASDTNRYLITVKPGIYDEQVTMKQFVDIFGSGQENTKITSGAGGTGYCYTAGTVLMESNTRIENISVENTNSDTDCAVAINVNAKTNAVVQKVYAEANGNTTYGAYAIYINSSNASASIKNSIAIATSSAQETYGVFVFGDYSLVIIDNVNASATSSGGASSVSAGISYWVGTSLIISNSVSTGSGGESSYGIEIWNPNVQIHNVRASAESGSVENYGIGSHWGPTTVTGSEAISKGVGSYGAYSHSGLLSITNSKISGDNFGIYQTVTGSFKVGNSMVGGGHNGVAGVDKVVNCHDQNFDPIPNL